MYVLVLVSCEFYMYCISQYMAVELTVSCQFKMLSFSEIDNKNLDTSYIALSNNLLVYEHPRKLLNEVRFEKTKNITKNQDLIINKRTVISHDCQ